MSNESYWKKRAAQRMFEHMQLAEETAEQIAQLYLKASRYLLTQMQDVFEKYMTKHKLSEAEARRLIAMLQDPTSFKEMLRQLQNKDFSSKTKEQLLMELEAPAYQARIERLQQLQNQIDLVMNQVYQQEKDFHTSHYVDLAHEAYYRSIFDIQQRVGIGFSFAHIDAKTIDKVINSKWSGMNYSSRIWRNTKALAQNLKQELLINLITGRTEREVAEILANKFTQGSTVARRLVRTESCFLANQLEIESYKECDIEKYRFVATLDLKTSEICASLDGKIFPVSEQQPGKNCPPMHPWCRSTTIAHISEDYDKTMKRRAYDPVKGQSILLPASMTYREWFNEYVLGKPKAELELKKTKNRYNDKKQYKKYREVIGDEMPKTLADFQDIKYTNINKWNELKYDYRIVKQYRKVVGDISSKKIVDLHEKNMAFRNNFKDGAGKKGNATTLEFEGHYYYANSSIQNNRSKGYLKYKGNKEDLILLKAKKDRAFETSIEKSTEPPYQQWQRCIDGEAKTMEFLHEKNERSKSSIAYLITDFPMCDSCKDVLKQFMQKDSNIELRIVEGVGNGKD